MILYKKHEISEQERKGLVADLAKEKCQKLQLTNHKTGWNALCRVWDGFRVFEAKKLRGNTLTIVKSCSCWATVFRFDWHDLIG
jgi:hypothetical protein